MGSEPKWLIDWNEKVEKVLGVTRSQAEKVLSRDQIIGAFRKIEFGSDPHTEKRITLIREMYNDYNISYTSHTNLFRDETDEQIWNSFRYGFLNVPKSQRPKKLIATRSLEERIASQERHKRLTSGSNAEEGTE